MNSETGKNSTIKSKISRRDFIKIFLTLGALSASGSLIYRQWQKYLRPEILLKRYATSSPVFVAKVKSYSEDITSMLISGFEELGVRESHIKNKRILLKPNYVETLAGADHINTHSMVIRAAIDAFFFFGASSIVVAEGSGNCRDTFLMLEETGLIEIINSYKVPFFDLNYSDCFTTPNLGHFSGLPIFVLPNELKKVDIVVSMAKLKTHHWAGITASMKNMFGIMPGSFYGWPKNVLHYAGIENCILDIVATVKPHFAIVDGIIGMEGDGPIMGTPKQSGVIVMGHNLASVDATCARIMDIDPDKVGYLSLASSLIGPITDNNIKQRGENIKDVRTRFFLCDNIPAMKRLRETV
jgi:uncharacterized protein (DUF362 family)